VGLPGTGSICCCFFSCFMQVVVVNIVELCQKKYIPYNNNNTCTTLPTTCKYYLLVDVHCIGGYWYCYRIVHVIIYFNTSRNS